VLAVCASSLIWHFRRIDHNGSHKPVTIFPLSNCTYNCLVIKKNKTFLRTVFHAHSQFLCSLASFRPSTAGVRHPNRTPSDRLLFDETFAQPCVFAVVNCAGAALSVFYSPVSTSAGCYCSHELRCRRRPLI